MQIQKLLLCLYLFFFVLGHQERKAKKSGGPSTARAPAQGLGLGQDHTPDLDQGHAPNLGQSEVQRMVRGLGSVKTRHIAAFCRYAISLLLNAVVVKIEQIYIWNERIF